MSAARSEAPFLEVVHVAPRAPNGRPPLLFLPGAFHGAWCFEAHWLPYFAERGYDAWAVSYRGHGRSAGVLRGASPRDYLEDIRRAIDTIGQVPVLVGHSMGGFLAQHLICTEPFPAAVLAAPVPVRGMNWPVVLRNALRFPLRTLRGLVSGDLSPLIDSPAFVHDFFAGLSDQAISVHRARMSGESAKAFLELGRFGWHPDPRGCHTPVLVLAGEKDRSWTPSRLAETARVFDARLEVVEGSGHDLMLDVGWRTAAESIAGWLEERLGGMGLHSVGS